MGVATTINLDPTSTSGIGALGRRGYWLIGACSKSESPFVNFLSLATLGLEGLESTTWGSLVLMIVHRPTFGSNVISPISSITILGGLMSGSICMFEVLFSVYCVFDLRMMIQVNGVFALIRGSTSMEFIDCMDVF